MLCHHFPFITWQISSISRFLQLFINVTKLRRIFWCWRVNHESWSCPLFLPLPVFWLTLPCKYLQLGRLYCSLSVDFLTVSMPWFLLQRWGRQPVIEGFCLFTIRTNFGPSGCHADSGGACVCQLEDGIWKLHGVVSCGSPSVLQVFARVSEFRNWIDKTMRSYNNMWSHNI